MPGARTPVLPLSERLRPVSLDDLAGNRAAGEELRSWARAWADSPPYPARRAAVLSGPPGVGKTSSALALAREMGWSVVEMNASDARNQASVERIAGRASMSSTLGFEGTYRVGKGRPRALILLDEADCLTGRVGDEARARPAPVGWREFLRTRYGAISALNDGWRLGSAGSPPAYESWEAMPSTAPRGRVAQLDAVQRDVADWRSSGVVSDLSDRGGLGAIARLVRQTRQPLILTVNDEQTLTRFSAVFRTGVERISFHPLKPGDLRLFLQSVARREKIPLDAKLLDALVHRARGDLRAALNDLDAISVAPTESTAQALLGVRDQQSELEELVGEVLSHPRIYRSGEIRDRLDATPDDLLPWIEENAPRYAGNASARQAVVERLAQADRLLAFARRHRVYALWSYAQELQTSGVGLAAAEGGPVAGARVGFPMFLGAMGRQRGQRAARRALVAKAQPHVHLSRQKSTSDLFPFLESIFGESAPPPAVRTLGRAIVRQWELSSEDFAAITGRDPGSGFDEWVAPAPEAPVALARPPSPERAADPLGPSTLAEPKKRQRRLGEF